MAGARKRRRVVLPGNTVVPVAGKDAGPEKRTRASRGGGRLRAAVGADRATKGRAKKKAAASAEPNGALARALSSWENEGGRTAPKAGAQKRSSSSKRRR
ncbi:MAG TPA: hypothetical protein VHN77_05680 [Phycisphaerales bacterium]|nr:hypothetical protein [Phycisphaerales bacterium]